MQEMSTAKFHAIAPSPQVRCACTDHTLDRRFRGVEGGITPTNAMSGFGGKADIKQGRSNVRF
jgi:hypothetical protein